MQINLKKIMNLNLIFKNENNSTGQTVTRKLSNEYSYVFLCEANNL